MARCPREPPWPFHPRCLLFPPSLPHDNTTTSLRVDISLECAITGCSVHSDPPVINHPFLKVLKIFLIWNFCFQTMLMLFKGAILSTDQGAGPEAEVTQRYTCNYLEIWDDCGCGQRWRLYPQIEEAFQVMQFGIVQKGLVLPHIPFQGNLVVSEDSFGWSG